MKTAVQETSLTAYRNEIAPTLGDRQRAVYAELENEYNLTNSELAQRLNWPINTITPRVYELRDMGLVFEDEKRTCSVTGRRVCAWAIKRSTLFI